MCREKRLLDLNPIVHVCVGLFAHERRKTRVISRLLPKTIWLKLLFGLILKIETLPTFTVNRQNLTEALFVSG